MSDPLLVMTMRKRLANGMGDDEVRIWSVTRGLRSGTTIRTFLEEYDEAINAAYGSGFRSGLTEGLTYG